MSDKDERAARLAAQLRANLHRRKAQARAADADQAASGAHLEASQARVSASSDGPIRSSTSE